MKRVAPLTVVPLGLLLCCGSVSYAEDAPAKPAADAAKAPDRVIEYRDDKLTLRVQNAPVPEVIEELRKQSKAEVRGQGAPDAKVTADFEAVPLNDALLRILGPHNFTLTYAEDGRLKMIDLKGGPEAARALKPSADSGDASDKPYVSEHPKWDNTVRTFENRKRVPVTGKLRELSEGDDVNWDWLIQGMYAIDDPQARSEALRTGLKALEEDKELRDATLAALNQMNDVELAEWVRAECKHTSERFMKAITRTSTNPEWQARARAILRELRKIPNAPGPHPEMH